MSGNDSKLKKCQKKYLLKKLSSINSINFEKISTKVVKLTSIYIDIIIIFLLN